MTAPGPARPLRALGMFVGLWIAGRIAFRWVAADGLPVAEAELAPSATAQRLAEGPDVQPPKFGGSAPWPLPSRARAAKLNPKGMQGWRLPTAWRADPDMTLSEAVPTPSGTPAEQETPALPLASPPANLRRHRARREPAWSGSVWAIARQGSGLGLNPGSGVLGGSEIGARAYRRLTPGLSLTGRVSTALASRQSDATVGLAVRRGALALIAERRFALDRGGRNDWSITAVAGVADVALPLDMRLDGYAQAGIVGRDGFADGTVRVERPLAATRSGGLSLGAGSWGSIQPGVARLDIGPQLVARTALGELPLRFSVEWRQRIAGTAAPGSGAVVTLGADF